MRWYRVLKVMWDFAMFLEKYFPEDSQFVDEKDFLKKLVLKLMELVEEE